MPRAWSTCSHTRCPTPTPPGRSRCDEHEREAERARRPDGNPYNTAGHQSFREDVLLNDPICVCTDDCPHHRGHQCIALSTVADHHPRSRRELEQAGLDPDDPAHGRGVCKRCHDRSTARLQPGGWHTPRP